MSVEHGTKLVMVVVVTGWLRHCATGHWYVVDGLPAGHLYPGVTVDVDVGQVVGQNTGAAGG